MKSMGEVIILKVVDDLKINQYFCRICFEGDSLIQSSSNPLEAPCFCKGSLKFAHRNCIQRWCNEKGNTVCEICLQNFEPGYTAPPKKALFINTLATLRTRAEIQTAEPEEPESPTYSADCLAAADRCFSCCKYVAFVLTMLLLLRHLLAMVAEETKDDYPFTLATLLVLRASGIIFPMYILIRLITALHGTIKHYGYLHIDEDGQLPDV